ncbi:hypothetical protein GCM10010505_57360 [Kitasatospora aburaviensis]
MPMQVGHFEWHGDEWLRRALAEAGDGLEAGMEHVLTESRKVVPLDEGTLERSGRSHVDRTSLKGAVSYDTPYAVRQHEELDYQHLPGRTAKYLETPFNREREVVLALIAAHIRRADHA